MDDEDMSPSPPSMAWLLTFADLVSLLITFFVLLYSMKVVDTQRWDELKGTFSGVFSIREPIYEVRPDKDTTIEKIDPIVGDNLDYIYALLSHSFLQSKTLADVLLYKDYSQDQLKVMIPNENFFQGQTAELMPDALAKIEELGEILRHLDNRVEVAGHTDDKPIRTRTYPSNWELSMMRSIKVAQELERQGVEQNLTVSGYGDSRIDAFLNEEHHEKREELANRVEIILHSYKER